MVDSDRPWLAVGREELPLGTTSRNSDNLSAARNGIYRDHPNVGNSIDFDLSLTGDGLCGSLVSVVYLWSLQPIAADQLEV